MVRVLSVVQVLVLIFSWLAADPLACGDEGRIRGDVQGPSASSDKSTAGSAVMLQGSASAAATRSDAPAASVLCSECACPCHPVLLLSAPVVPPALSAVCRQAIRLRHLVPAKLVRPIDRPPRLG